jgi:hypothetical protein
MVAKLNPKAMLSKPMKDKTAANPTGSPQALPVDKKIQSGMDKEKARGNTATLGAN